MVLINKPNYRRFEIWWVKLEPTEGSEASKTRPCLILQNDLGNQYSDVTIVVPFLEPRSYPFVVNVLPTKENGLDRERGLNFSQMRVVYYSRFGSKLGKLESSYIREIEEAIQRGLGGCPFAWGVPHERLNQEAIALELGIFGR